MNLRQVLACRLRVVTVRQQTTDSFSLAIETIDHFVSRRRVELSRVVIRRWHQT